VTVQVGLSPLSSFLAAEEEAGRFHSNGSCEAFTVCIFLSLKTTAKTNHFLSLDYSEICVQTRLHFN